MHRLLSPPSEWKLYFPVGAFLNICLAAGDDEARNRGTQKSVLERQAPATFRVVIEMRERAFWVTHWTEDSVDCVLHGKDPTVQVTLPSPKLCQLQHQTRNSIAGLRLTIANLHGLGKGRASKVEGWNSASAKLIYRCYDILYALALWHFQESMYAFTLPILLHSRCNFIAMLVLG